MAYQGAITTEGHYTTDSQGFTFQNAVAYQGSRTYYGRYCGAINGWYDYTPPGGGYTNPQPTTSTVGPHNYYQAPGSTIIKGTITPATFLLVQVAANYSARGTVTKAAVSGGRLYGEYILSGVGITISATAKAGYKFYMWSDGSTEATRTWTVYGDASYTAIFVPLTYKLVPGAIGLGAVAKILINGIEKSLASEIRFSAGDTIQAYQTPNINALFSAWMLNGTTYTSSTLLVVTGTYVEENIVLNAIFQTRDSYTFTATNTTPSMCSIAVTDGVTPRTETAGVITFTAYVGVKYTIATTVTDPVFDQVTGIYNGDTLLSSSVSYDFTKNDAGNVSLTIVAGPKPLYTLVTGVSDGSAGYGDLSPAAVAGCVATIETGADKTVDGVPKYLSKNVSIRATSGPGWELTGWNVQNTSGGSGGFTPSTAINPLTFLIGFNSFVKVNFARIRCTASVIVHAASSGKGTVSATPVNPSQNIDNLRYGDQVSFVAIPASGYFFGGWFDESGAEVSTDASYVIGLDGNRILTAKFAASVTLRASYIAPAVGSCLLNGVANNSETKLVSAHINFGDIAQISAVPEEGCYFGSWFLTSDETFSNPLSLDSADSFIVTNTVDYTVKFSLVLSRFYLSILNMDNNTDPPSEAEILGHIAASPGQEIELTAYNNWLYGAFTPSDGGLQPNTDMPGKNRYYLFDGTINTLINAIGATGRKFVRWGISEITKDEGTGVPTIGDETTYSVNAGINLVMNRHYRLRAYWGEIKPVTIRVAYGMGFSSINGLLSMSGETASRIVSSSGEITDTIVQVSQISIRADMKSGFLFAGWYADADCSGAPISTSLEYGFSVDVPVTFYAAFKPDTNAIYEWCGASTRKNALWVSRRYDSPVCFSPSSARVFATGYPVSLVVSMFESPDVTASPSGVVRVTPIDQNAIRLPRVRSAKYMLVAIESGNPVETVSVGTSMKGLAE